MDLLLGLIGIAAFLLFCVYIPAYMANRRGRNPYIWIFVSVLISPLLGILLLFLLGQKRA